MAALDIKTANFAAALKAKYDADGYAVVRGVFTPAEMAELGRAFDRHYAEGLRHGRSFRHQNLFYRVTPDANLGAVVRFVQWPSYADADFDRFRLDPRMFAIAGALLGPDLKQIINQLHWKPPGAAMADFAFHQDCRFRRPPEAYRDLASSYAQTGIAVDAHRRANGAMRILPGSHRAGDLGLVESGPVLAQTMQDDSLRKVGLDPAGLIDLEMEVGDVALWSPFLVHGSGPNTTRGDRRLYINGFASAASCDRGEWAFRGGKAVKLSGKPALVHYDDVHTRPEPHYVDEAY
jgi:ectoine hydroxylase-related dioxygenase (phytanoyl-CoA dioxygenase family)